MIVKRGWLDGPPNLFSDLLSYIEVLGCPPVPMLSNTVMGGCEYMTSRHQTAIAPIPYSHIRAAVEHLPCLGVGGAMRTDPRAARRRSR